MGVRSRGSKKAHAATSRIRIEKTKCGRSFASWRVWCSAPAASLAWRSSSIDSMSWSTSPISSPRSRSEPVGRAYDAPVSGEPHIRKVRSDDLEEVWRVHVASSNDGMAHRGGPAASPADRPVASDARAALISDPDGYFCAVEEGRVRGMVSALVRGQVWYLSMFFVLPGDQSRGLGRAPLEPA